MGTLVIFLLASYLFGKPVQWALAPSLSPNGEYTTFSYHGDLWIAPSQGGMAIRMTSLSGFETNPLWSPDGKYIAFESDESGNFEIYIMPSDGSASPTRLTYHPAYEHLLGFSSDSKYVLFVSDYYDLRGGVYQIPISGGNPQKVMDFEVNELTYCGNDLCVIERGNEPWYRRGYRGPGDDELFLYSAKDGSFQRLTNNDFRDARPMFSKATQKLYFLSNGYVNGVTNLCQIDLKTGSVNPLTSFKEEVNWAGISDNGEKIVLEVLGRIYLYDLLSGRLFEPDIRVMEDFDPEMELTMDIRSNITDFSISPNGKEIALVALGDIFVINVDSSSLNFGKVVRITNTPEPEKDVRWNPEGSYIYFTSLKDGNYNIYRVKPSSKSLFSEDFSYKEEVVVNLDGTDRNPQVSPDGSKIAFIKDRGKLFVKDLKTQKVFRLGNHYDVLWFSWSPDSRYIAYSRTEIGPREDVYVVEVKEGATPVNISNHPNDDYRPLWTKDGKRLFFASRNYEGDWWAKYVFLDDSTFRAKDEYLKTVSEKDTLKDSVRIDFEGLRDRIVTVYRFRAYYNFYTISPNGLTIAVQAEDLNGNDVWVVDHEGKRPRRITTGNVTPQKMEFTGDGKTLYFLGENGKLYVSDVEKGDYREVNVNGQVSTTFGDLYRSLMLEGWWLLKDGFYDEKMHGVNWESMLIKYLPLTSYVKTYREFNNVVYRMLGELNASHLGIWQKERESKERFSDLGIVVVPNAGGKGVKVEKVIKGSPADRGKIVKGDVILSVNGKEVEQNLQFSYYLRNLEGNEVLLKVQRGSKKGKVKEIKVKPVSYWEVRDLIYKEWVEGNRRVVDSLSKGDFAYIHIRGMGDWNYTEFEKDIYENRNKKGLVLDIRYNGGGHIHDELLNFLRRTRYLVEKERDGDYEFNTLFRWDKPIVLLINQYCFSDAEIFPAGFKALKLGKVVGTSTFGGVIGTTDHTLFDGRTIFREPHEGWYFDVNGVSLENTPVDPDISVEDQILEDNYPGSTILKKGVEVLKEMVEH